MSPGDALTGKGHVRYSTGLADPQEADQRSPTSSCAQNSQICTALVLIGIEPAPAQNDLICAPQLMSAKGPLAAQLGGYRMSSGGPAGIEVIGLALSEDEISSHAPMSCG